MTGDGLTLATRLGGLQAVRVLLSLVAVAASGAGWGPSAGVAQAVLAYAAVTAAVELHRRSRRRRGWAATTAVLYLDVLVIQLASTGWEATSSPFAFMAATHVVAVVVLAGHRTGLRIAMWHGIVGFGAATLRLAGVGAPVTAAQVRELGIATAGLLLVAATTATLGRVVEREEAARRRDAEALAHLGHVLQSLSRPEAIAEEVAHIAVDRLGFQRAAILTDLPAAEAVCEDGSALVADAASLPPVVAAALPDSHNVVVVPLAQGARMGVAAFEWGADRDRIPGRVIRLVERCCTTTSLALERAALQAEVHRLATTDALTGLANRRVAMDVLGHHLARSRRHGATVCLLLIDVDHFKAVNDTHGHAVGDEVLRHIGSVLRRSCREADLPARYGGEEFVVLLPDETVHGAMALGERLREALGDGTGPVPITASLGLAACPAHARDADQLFAAADQALYRAKAGGRNRLEVAVSERWAAPAAG